MERQISKVCLHVVIYIFLSHGKNIHLSERRIYFGSNCKNIVKIFTFCFVVSNCLLVVSNCLLVVGNCLLVVGNCRLLSVISTTPLAVYISFMHIICTCSTVISGKAEPNGSNANSCLATSFSFAKGSGKGNFCLIFSSRFFLHVVQIAKTKYS